MSSVEMEEKKDASYVVTEGVTEPVVLDANNESIVRQYSVKRVMTTRQIQFYAIGGTIGTAVFVSVSTMSTR
jgi:amino acid permease